MNVYRIRCRLTDRRRLHGIGRWIVQLSRVVVCGCGIACSQTVVPTAAADQEGSTSVYGFAFLGDLHFDRLAHHDMDWVRENHPGDVRQIENYSRVTRRNSGPLLELVSDTLKHHAAPPFGILQAGDFVEGLCGSYGLQAKQFTEAMAFVESAVAPLPFLVTKGNHDITGPGAEAAYGDVLLPWLGRQLGMNIDRTSYVVRHGGDLFIFFDGYKPDLGWLENVLREQDARHVFFLVHEPVVPFNARSQWYLFSRDKSPSRRERLLSLLGEHQVIVLCGHLHHYSVVRRKTEGGIFVQMSMNSVIDLHPRSVSIREGRERYAPELVDLEPGFAPDTQRARRETLKMEQPWVEFFELAKTPAWALVTASDEAVRVDVRLQLDSQIWRSLRIENSSMRITLDPDPSCAR